MNFMKSFRNKKKEKNVAPEDTAAVDVPRCSKKRINTLLQLEKKSHSLIKEYELYGANKLPEHEEERRNVAPDETATVDVPETKKTYSPAVEKKYSTNQ